MTRARPFLLLPLLSIAVVIAVAVMACQTQRRPLTGFDTQPPGTIFLDSRNPTSSTVMLWPIFDLPPTVEQIFMPRLNDQDAVIVTSDEGFYDYDKLYLNGWTGGYSDGINGVPSGTYTVELLDADGQSWGQSAPLPVPPGVGGFNTNTTNTPSAQLPTVILTHFGKQMGSWTIDPTTQDSDPTTDEITVTNLLQDDVAVERCLVTAGSRTSCTSVGTVAPGADLLTVETIAEASSTADHQALFIHLASDVTQSYQRDLVQAVGFAGSSCQVERILVHGSVPTSSEIQSGTTQFAMSSCYGYQSRSYDPSAPPVPSSRRTSGM